MRKTLFVHLLVALCVLLVGAATAGATPWVARHGLTAAEYQTQFDQLAAQGYRLTSVSGYEQDGAARYAATWEQRSGPAWQARHGLTAARYQATFNRLTDQGYRPVLVNGYSVRGSARYAAIFERGGRGAWVARHGLTPAQYQDEFNTWVGRGYRLTHVSGYTDHGAERYAAVFNKTPGPAWRAVHGLSAAQYQATFNRLSQRGYRPVDVSGHAFRGQDRYAAIFEQGAALPWVARHGLDAGEHQATVTDLHYQAYEPEFVDAFASTTGPRFSSVWHNPAFSGADLDHIDTTVGNAMRAANVTGLSLAIADHGRLVFAKSYGYADAVQKTPLHTTHRLRQASVSKPFTAIEVMRLVEAGRIKLGDQVFGANGLLGETYGKESTYKDPRVLNITVQELLEHTGGGWDNDGDDGSADPMFLETGKSQGDLIQWVLQNVGLDKAPGTTYQYSNFGYLVLGRLIEKVTGKSYADAMRDDVFAPSGASSFAIAGDTLADRLPDEVAYQHDGAQTAPYAMKVARMDAHGGWVATPVDVVRAALRGDGFDTVPDVIGADTATTMSTVSTAMREDGTASNYAKGWLINSSGPNWFHDGYLPGTRSILERRADGILWSAAVNSTNADRKTDIDLDQVMRGVVSGVSAWPAHDLF